MVAADDAAAELMELREAEALGAFDDYHRGVRNVHADFDDRCCHKNIRFIALPFVSQNDYDWLLLHCDLNIVRGEDSFVRAQWAGKPFIWHIYPQSDGAHLLKLDAFLNQYLQGAKPSVKKAVNLAMHWQSPKEWLLDLKSIDEHANVWRDRLFELTKDGDLAQSLRTFISEKC